MSKKVFEFIFKLFWYLPLLSYFSRRSYIFVCLYFVFLYNTKKYNMAYDFMLGVLAKSYFKKQENAGKWWSLMRLIVTSLQEQQIHNLSFNPSIEERIMYLGIEFSNRTKDYNTAYCFIAYSLWLFERGSVYDSINMAEIAVECDSSWAYAYYLLGWFNLFVNQDKSIDFFCQAVNIDWGFLHRIKKDRTCQQYPNIIKEVGKRVIIK